MKLSFEIRTKTETGSLSFRMGEAHVLGRSLKSDTAVSDALLSGNHCKFILQPTKLLLFDLGSKNGTFLNGVRIDRAEIFLGDEIRIGSTKLSFKTEGLDPNLRLLLTYKGNACDRMADVMKLDFTGARTVPVARQKTKPREFGMKFSEKGAVLSKEEVRLRNRRISSTASVLDFCLMGLAIALPVFLFKLPLAAACLIIAYLFNFKILRFTLGEKISGLEEKYFEQ